MSNDGFTKLCYRLSKLNIISRKAIEDEFEIEISEEKIKEIADNLGKYSQDDDSNSPFEIDSFDELEQDFIEECEKNFDIQTITID